jgi:glyceraldehyde-3-phosphate dehydrogenase/erythrose-4-phosphate dehydrogenase
MNEHPRLILIAAEADMSEANVKRATASGRSHNEWGFSNRMLDVTMALMRAK